MSKQSEVFYTLLDEMKQVHDAKRHDYADKADVFKNFRLSEMGGIPAWKGCAIRIGDKFSRLMSFLKQEELKVKDESIRDTLIDLANYAIICAILYGEKKQKDFDAIDKTGVSAIHTDWDVNSPEYKDPFERNKAYIEHRKEFPYYPDKNKETDLYKDTILEGKD